MTTISITPPLTLEEMKSFGEFRTVYCVPADGGGAGALVPREGVNYRPRWIQEHIQAIVDFFPTHEFTGYVECRNGSEDHLPVARYYVRGRRVEMVTPTLVWPDNAAPAAAEAFRELLASIWLYVSWRFVTRQLTTEQKELWADAVDTHTRAGQIEDGEDVHPVADRWWRDA